MSGRTRLTPAEFAELQGRRQASSEAAARGRAHRALPLDEVERREREKRVAWAMVCPICNSGTPGCCNCLPLPKEAASAVSEFLSDPPKPKPPRTPWRELFAGLLVLLFAVSCVHVIATATKPQQQVTKR